MLFLKALKREPIPRTPVWLMRQAGRYLPEYQAVRKKAGDFLTLCKTPQLACEVTLQPLKRFDLDAAIIFSDILTIPDAMGLGLTFIEGTGPVFKNPLTDLPSVESIAMDPLLERLSYVTEAIDLVRTQLPPDLPLIGFAGSPWTLACYMLEGGSSRTYHALLRAMYQTPTQVHRLLTWLAQVTVRYLQAQIDAGCQTIMLFDTWGGLLAPAYYREFSLFYMQQIIKRLPPTIPTILFTKGIGAALPDLAQVGATAIGLDWTQDLHTVRQQWGHLVALQGNLDPAILLTNATTIEHAVQRVLNDFGEGSGHIFNLGHGITPDVPPEHVACMVRAVRQFSPAFHTVQG